MIAYAFAGQGSQRRGMGEALFARYPRIVRAANEILGYSVEELCRSGDGRLRQTECTQPAVFVVNALTYLETHERLGTNPHYLLGHSLGELNALYAAGVFDFETALRIVKMRGKLMSRCPDGAMAALLGERETLLSLITGMDDVYLANDNSARQIVVAGPRNALTALQSRVGAAGEFIPLAVSGAFHSPLMQSARDAFASFLAEQTFRAPEIPVIANVSAAPHTVADLRTSLAEHLVRPVRWRDSITYLLQRGPMLFQEIGPSPVLAPLIRQIILG
jgi:trans-AT polyketide synthase/acyltransferase/oxidoreductase domain-containing protein